MRRLFKTLLVFVVILTLVGCNTQDDSPTCEHTYENNVCIKCGEIQIVENEIVYNQTGFDGKGMDVLIYCAPDDLDPFHESYTKSDQMIKQGRINEIEEAYKINLVFKEYPKTASYGYYRINYIENNLKENKSSEKGHIFVVSSDWLVTLSSSGLLADIYDETTQSGILNEIENNFNENFKKLYSVNSKVYGYEYETRHADHFLYYNIDLIEKFGLENPATLWNEGKWDYTSFKDYLQKASDAFASVSKEMYPLGGKVGDITLGILSGSGYKLIDEETNTVNFVNDNNLSIYKDLNEIYHNNKWARDSVASDVSMNFVNGQQLFTSGALWYILSSMMFKDNVDFEIGIVPYPARDGSARPIGEVVDNYLVPSYGNTCFVFANGDDISSKVLVNIVDDLQHGVNKNQDNESREEYVQYLETLFSETSEYKEASINAIMTIEDNLDKYLYYDYMSVVDAYLNFTVDSWAWLIGYDTWSPSIISNDVESIENLLNSKQIEYQKALNVLLRKVA